MGEKEYLVVNRISKFRVKGLGRIDFVNEEIEHSHRTD